ncbi:Piso0_004564 [Millerozyma farinosa CBS 7064]|uniref:rRNA methyltransferase 2, mitochondrial n=1 Tax=Pichia sorbitophila (strain ATCC MYA-4447 / BCRC 22081 / CBS 7064 / NBRC 10061 / NRRL Y-12695) TaxID=559304 RepID=G8Y5T7_PICSO|nr:Piso0_004564 [Millerozyma farinosa CBS 7064]CCE84998.1 Piso0_004564 [Millerozyma farinosa CBS 7064]
MVGSRTYIRDLQALSSIVTNTRRNLCGSARLNIAALSQRLFARNVTEEQGVQYSRKVKAKVPRTERIASENAASFGRLERADQEFTIFDKSITRVLDLGYVSGNWSFYSKERMMEIHGLEEDKFNDKCHILGFDLLFGTPPPGVSSMQGNIFSKGCQDLIISHFKEVALRNKFRMLKIEEAQRSYFFKEQKESFIEKKIEELSDVLSGTALTELKNASFSDYKPDLILSDLSSPHLQERGYFNNTNTKPYLRMNSNPALSKVILRDHKLSIDLADASLVLVSQLLRQNGKFVIRLCLGDPEDKEVNVFERRLKNVFGNVTLWKDPDNFQAPKNYHEIYFICTSKLEDSPDKKKVFLDI